MVVTMTSTALEPRKNRLLLLEQCLLPELRAARPPARDRLEAALGAELSRRLVVALTRARAAY
jgi:hypothetical protein